MVNFFKMKKNLLIISPSTPQVAANAGDWRVVSLTKELAKSFNVSFMPLKYKSSAKYIKSLKNVKIVKIIRDINKFSNFIKKDKIETLIIEKYWDIPFDVCGYMSAVKTSIIDVHEIGFKKTEALLKIKDIENNKVYKAKELMLYKQADILIAISEPEKNELKKYFPDKKIILIPTCTDDSETNVNFNKRKDICYFGFYGHNPNKDAINYFIENIFEKLLKIKPEMRFYILGKGAGIFKNLHKNIITNGNIKDINGELSKYRVFVCPLRYGAGIKKKVLDAMASKTPVVSTKYGYEGIKGTEKYAVDCNPSDFAKAVFELYDNERKWNKISKDNFNIVKKHYSVKCFEKYVRKLAEYIYKTF